MLQLPKQNLTLSIERELLREARKYALDHGTTVNEIVRVHLTKIVEDKGRRKAAAKRLRDFLSRPKADLSGWDWNREDLYERS